MKIAVLAGGLSPERDVSLSSGSLIANALMEAGHAVLLLDVYEGSKTVASDDRDIFLTRGVKYEYLISEAEPNLEEIVKRNGNRKELIGPNVLPLCQKADVVFLALHGAMGENGQLQATLDNFGIRYTGSGYIGSLLAMDKDIAKRLLVQSDILTADWILFDCKADSADRIRAEVGFPCVVKPCSCGSSVGVSMVDDEPALAKALESAKLYETSVVVEKKIVGREFSVGILDNIALPPIEIIPKTGFYDYKNKYQGGMASEICPAELSPADTRKVQDIALSVHTALRLGGYSRIDFIRDAEGNFWCLEANTLPGMTPTSLLPQEAAAIGISYIQLCEKIAHMPLRSLNSAY